MPKAPENRAFLPDPQSYQSWKANKGFSLPEFSRGKRRRRARALHGGDVEATGVAEAEVTHHSGAREDEIDEWAGRRRKALSNIVKGRRRAAGGDH